VLISVLRASNAHIEEALASQRPTTIDDNKGHVDDEFQRSVLFHLQFFCWTDLIGRFESLIAG
jgi:hypothetical protein